MEARANVTHARARLTIDLGAIVANWKRLGVLAQPAEVAAVVKADAYGLGLRPVASALASAGCTTFFVAHASEGSSLRQILRDGGHTASIYILHGGPLEAAGFELYRSHDLRPVLASLPELDFWASALKYPGVLPASAVHFDTGMNRLGLREADVEAARAVSPTLVMSHFIASEIASDPLNRVQMARFARLRSAFPNAKASLANSSGIFLGPEALHDLVRPGFALYGGNPCPSLANPMLPIVQLDVPMLQIRDVGAGETIGYGAGFTARRPMRLAILPLGYADGFARSGGAMDAGPEQGALALVEGYACRFVGRVSMDLTVIDVSAVPEALLQPGVMAQVLGQAISIDDLASATRRIGYEVLTGLGQRFERVYRTAS